MVSSRTGRTSLTPAPSKSRGPRRLAPPRDPAPSIAHRPAARDARVCPAEPHVRRPLHRRSRASYRRRRTDTGSRLRLPPVPSAGVATFPSFAIGAATSYTTGRPGATIDARGAGWLDRVLDFAAFVTRLMPLSLLLDEARRGGAAIVGADAASLYLRDGRDGEVLVLRGNVGFPRGREPARAAYAHPPRCGPDAGARRTSFSIMDRRRPYRLACPRPDAPT
jgi:hypothetical protein